MTINSNTALIVLVPTMLAFKAKRGSNFEQKIQILQKNKKKTKTVFKKVYLSKRRVSICLD